LAIVKARQKHLVVSAFGSVNDAILHRLDKDHTAADAPPQR
jgi:hypothetical protein